MMTPNNTSPVPTSVTPSTETPILPSKTITGVSNKTVAMTTTTLDSNHSTSVTAVVTILKSIANATASAATGSNSQAASSLDSDLEEMMNSTSSVSMATTASPQLLPTTPSVTTTPKYNAWSSEMPSNNITVSLNTVSIMQVSSSHDTAVTRTISVAVQPSMIVASRTPTLPNNTAVSTSNTVNSTSNPYMSTSSVLTPTPVLNMTSISSTVRGAKKRRRRDVGVRVLSGNSNSSSGNDSVMSSTSVGLAGGSITAVVNSNTPMSSLSPSSASASASPSSTSTSISSSPSPSYTSISSSPSLSSSPSSSSSSSTSISSSSTSPSLSSSPSSTSLSSSPAPSPRLSLLPPSSSENSTETSLPASSTTANRTVDQPVASTVTLTTSTSNITSTAVSMITGSRSPALPVPSTASHLYNSSSMVVTSDTSTSTITANATSSSSATLATVSITTHSITSGVSSDFTLSVSSTQSMDNVANTANVSASTPALSMNVSTMASKPLGITVHINHTSSQSSKTPDVNKSSTVQPVTVVMTTPSVAMTLAASSSNLDGTVASTLVSPSKSLDVQFTSQVANVTSSSSILFSTLTPTSIHPTPILTSLTPSDTSYIMSSAVSSSHRKNILLTTSSLGICWIVYTTQVMHSSMLPGPTSATGLNQTTSYTRSTKSVIRNTSHVFSSITPSKSPVLEMNSTTVTRTAVVTRSTLMINVSAPTSTIHIQQTSTSIPPVDNTHTLTVNTTKTTGYISKSIADNTTSLSPVATSVPSMVSKATANSTIHPSATVSSLIEVVRTSSVINSSSLTYSSSGTSLLTVAASQTSNIVMLTTAVSSSMTTVVMATSSVFTTPLPSTTSTPTTSPVLSTLMKTTLQIPRNVDVDDNELRRNVSKGLEETYNSANTARRRRRATDGTEAKIYNITRMDPPSTDAMILFTITRNGRMLSAADAVAVYDKIANLSSIGVWKVTSRPETFLVPTPPPQNVLVSMIFERINRDLSVPSNKKAMEERLASYYKTRKNTREIVTATIHVILLEKTQHVYIQFYITEGETQVPAAIVVRVFEVEHVTQLTAYLQEQVIVAPYTDESLQGQQTDYIQTRVSATPSDIQDPTFNNKLGNKLATAYITGKAKGNSRRKRRAIGSVSATIVNVTVVNGSSSYADVIFFIFDSGKVANATYAAAVLNKLTRNEMSIITSPYAIITSPRPVKVPVSTETPPATIPPVVIPYWIIGAVLGPIFLIIIIILLIYWRWRSGAPQSKVQPAVQKTPDYLRKPRMQPMETHDEVRYSESKPPVSKITNMSVATDRSYENLPRRETSLRRKVTKTSMQKRRDMSRSNAAYEESEEDEDYDNSFITVSSTSHNKTITAQPGPGMKDRRTTSIPVKSAPQRTPKKIPEKEETETESSESEAESVGTARTDQTKFSAAQVPTVAVMGGSSGNQPQVPVRFRSSVHPVSSLPPIHNKQTSLVGPPSDDEDVTPRKSKRRSKAAQQELKQKADMERLRNKKRQRERKNKVTPVQSSERRAWARDELEQVLDPRPIDPFSRSKRRKPQRSKRADSVATDEDAIELKSYKRHGSPEDTIKQPANEEEQTEDQSGESSDESSISMEETRKRMHTLLDDAFSLLGPLSQKQKQRPSTLQGPGDYYKRPPVPARYAGSRPALPEPAPAHGRATEPTPRQRRRLGNTGGFPHGLPQTPIGPGYPVRPPMRPPLVTSDPVVVWDPYERQRYINQRMGFPQGSANPTYAYADSQGQNIYITPVQQQRDYLGGPVWSPYAAEDTMEELYPDLSKSNYPGAYGTSPPKDSGFRDVNPRDTVIDMNDQYGQRRGALGQAPQPLIRSIKDELLRLSNGGVRRTPITEL